MWNRRRNTSYFGSTNSAHAGGSQGSGGMVGGSNEPYQPRSSGGTNFSRGSNSSYYPRTSPALDSGGSVLGTTSPSGSFGKPIGYVNDDPIGSNTSAARPFGGFGMGDGAYSKKDAGVGGPVNVSAGRTFRPRHFRRSAGGFAGLARHYQPTGALANIFSGQQS